MVAQAVEQRHLLLFPRQMRFVRNPATFCAYIGGIGSGKSFSGAAKVVKRLAYPGRGMIVAPTYPMLRDATRQTLTDLLDLLGIAYVLHKSENTITIPASGHEILCRSADKFDSLRGPNLDYAWVDEPAMVAFEGWRVIKGRVRVDRAVVDPSLGPTVIPHQSWITGTPKGRNWIWEEWERDATGTEFDPTHPLYRVRTDENPELPEGFAQSLGYSGVFAEQELGGAFVAFEGLVYAGFHRPTHVKTLNVDGWRTVLGVDVGSRNPTAVLTVHIAGDERVHVGREVYRRNLSSTDILDAVRGEAGRVNPERIYVDPSAAGYIDDFIREGYRAEKANNDVLEGIGRVTDVLVRGFTIDPSCVHTIAEFEAYHYPEGGKQAYIDKPLKENDHAMDALRYAVMGISNPVPPPVAAAGIQQRSQWR